MPKNVEVKARLPKGVKPTREFLMKNSDEPDGMWKFTSHYKVEQRDTFFNSDEGRLKLRVEKNCHISQRERAPTVPAPSKATLIGYHRENKEGPTSSHYVLTSIPEPDRFSEVLSMTIGVKGVVEKIREVFVMRTLRWEFDDLTTRVHLDTVSGLGEFLELEVLITKEEDIKRGQDLAELVLSMLSIPQDTLVPVAYHDLHAEMD